MVIGAYIRATVPLLVGGNLDSAGLMMTRMLVTGFLDNQTAATLKRTENNFKWWEDNHHEFPTMEGSGDTSNIDLLFYIGLDFDFDFERKNIN